MSLLSLRRTISPVVAAVVALTAALAAPGLIPEGPAAAATSASCDVQIHPEVDDAGFTHPGIGLTAQNLADARAGVAAGEEPWTSYYNQMRQSTAAAATVTSSNASASDVTKPMTTAFNSQAVESRFIADGLKVYSQALMYYFTGQETYRANAMAILRIWEQMDPAQYGQYPDSHIHTGIPLNRMLTGAEVLRYSSCGTDETAPWTQSDTTKLTANLITPVIENFQHDQNHFMNQHLYPLLGAMAGYIFTGNDTRYAEAVEWFTVNSTADNSGFNGSIERLFRMVDRDDKTGQPIADPHVQQVEMGRDQAHGGGDLTNAYYLARMMLAQHTKVDPVRGTISTAANAVGPYEFLQDRILAAADYFWQFMLGYDPEWTPVGYSISPNGTIRDTYDHISHAYRGRYNTASFWDLYYYYTFTRHEDLTKKAPYYAEAFQKRLPLIYNYNGAAVNAWDSPDGGGDFWLYVPPAAAGTSIPKPQASKTVLDIEDRYTAISGDVAAGSENGTGYVRLGASATGSKLAYLTGSTASKALSFRIRTDGTAKLAMVADSVHETITLPNTQGAWRDFRVTLTASESVPDLFYLTATGDGADVDVDSMNTAPTGTALTWGNVTARIVTWTGQQTTTDLSAANTGLLTYSADGLPNGAALDPATGKLTWDARTAGSFTFTEAVSDGTSCVARDVTVASAQGRGGALRLAKTGYRGGVEYEPATATAYQAAWNSATAAADTGTDAAYLDTLRTLVTATNGLKLESPRLADGSLDYPALLSSSSAGTTVSTLTDGTNQTGTTYQTASGLAQIVNFGPSSRVTASKFGLQSNIFEDRLANSAVFGSNNGTDWTRLTPDVTKMTQDYQVLDVAPDLRQTRFQFFKVQLLQPLPDVLYGTVNNLFEMTEFHIYGDRHPTAGQLDHVSIAGPSTAVKGRVIAGDAVTLTFHSPDPVTNPVVTIGRSTATAASSDGQTWTAQAAVSASVKTNQQLPFSIDWTTPDGRAADQVGTTTDGSKLYVSTNQGLIDAVIAATQPKNDAGQVVASITTDAARLFDNNAGTHSDTRLVNGRASIVWDLGAGSAATITGVDVLVRQDQYGTSRLSTLRFEGSADGTTWTPMTTTVTASADWQHLDSTNAGAFRYLRLTNGNIINIAETRVFGTVSGPAAP